MPWSLKYALLLGVCPFLRICLVSEQFTRNCSLSINTVFKHLYIYTPNKLHCDECTVNGTVGDFEMQVAKFTCLRRTVVRSPQIIMYLRLQGLLKYLLSRTLPLDYSCA